MIPLPEQSPSFNRNMSRGTKDGYGNCILCGKPTKLEGANWICLGQGNSMVGFEEEFKQHEIEARGEVYGDFGGWPIGNDCLRRHPELKEYAR